MALALACDGGHPPPPGFPDAGPPSACDGTPEGVVCVGNVAHDCDGSGGTRGTDDCGASGQACAAGLGCRTCAPSAVRCVDETPEVCDPDGSGWTAGAACDVAAGLHCSALGCRDLCADAAMSASYIGCEYWPVTTLNSELAPEFDFAVVIANPGLVTARVTVEREGAVVAERDIGAGELETIRLPWVEALVRPTDRGSALVRGGAYRLRSSVPVTVYQFDPLDYRIERDCAVEPREDAPDGQCFSYTNDASLLLPTTVLTGSYLAIARATQLSRLSGEPSALSGFVAIVGASATPVDVEVTTRAHVRASEDGAVSAMAPGDTQSFTLEAGDVVEIASDSPTGDECTAGWEDESRADVQYCPLGPEYDLTGTEIRASGPVAVVAGHDCTFVPFDRWACDHLEEEIFPVESWGREAIVSRTLPVRGEPNLVRVVSAADDNAIHFEPADVGPDVVLARGAFVELTLTDDVRITGTEPFAAVQILVGQDYFGLGASGFRPNGDPAMALAIPTEQHRSSYTFLTPESFEESFVNVTAPAGTRVVLDGDLLGGLEAIGDTGASALRQRVRAGTHRIEANAPFGIVVYGYGTYTSYLYPGGLDLRRIGPPI